MRRFFFKEPVENLVSDSAIEAISGGSEYQVPHYAHLIFPRRELAAPIRVRYLRKPDENEGRSHGAIGPRAFVMPLMDVDQMNLGPRFLRDGPISSSPTWTRTKTKGSKDPCAAITPMGERRIKPEVPPSVYYAICGHHLIPRVGRFRR